MKVILKFVLKQSLFVAHLLSLSNAFSQESMNELSRYELYQLHFDTINALEDKAYSVDNLDYLDKIVQVHTDKAIRDNDTMELANSYVYRVWYKPPEIGLKYLDSTITLTEQYRNTIFPGRAYYLKGVLLYEVDQPGEAMKNFIRSYHLAKQAANHEQVVDCLNGIAVLKSEYGQEQEGILLHQEALNYLEKYATEIEEYEWTKLLTLENMTLGYLELKELDSVRVFAKKGMQLAIADKDTLTYQKLNIALAQANYYEGNYLKSRDTLLNYVDLYDGIQKADILYYLGKIGGKIGRPEHMAHRFQEIHQIIKNDSSVIDNVKEVYQTLLQNAMNTGNSEKENEYLQWLVYYDKIVESMQRDVRQISLVDFDMPIRELQRKELQNQISKKKKSIWVLYLLTGLVGIAGTFWFYRYQNTQRKLKALMQNKLVPIRGISRETSKTQTRLDIDESTVAEVLNNLENWELNKGYLDTVVTQNSLAKELGTNSTYLSRIINTHKGQNFSNYLKDLRISYAVNFIKANPSFIRNKSIIQIAEHFGFNSLDVFARALKRKTGVTPAAFLKRVNQSNL